MALLGKKLQPTNHGWSTYQSFACWLLHLVIVQKVKRFFYIHTTEKAEG
jgi:hypothetical protein